MAGSIKTFEYTTDAGDTFAVRMDESNGEAVGNADYTDSSTATFFLPRNIEARRAEYLSADGLYKRSIIVTSNTATTASLPASIDVQDGNGGTVTVLLSSLTGEKATIIPKAQDTAITDGDDT